ncbi:MAG TPA: serine hydrolase [Gemmatimonadales bacterium]|nr:serine hydrolase [Gemmatimonadales bacterium]
MTRHLLAVLMFVSPARPAPAQEPSTLAERLAERMARAPARAVGLYYRGLVGPDSVLIGANLRFHAASTMKVPVMIQLFRDADAGLLRLDDSLTVHVAFPSLVEGQAFVVGRKDDSDSTLYAWEGRNRSVRDLLELMITRSSNLATNILIERVGAARAQTSARALGAWSIQVLRGVEDGLAYRTGLNNTTTARDLGVLLLAIAQRRAASRAACDSMLAILGRQEFNEGIPAGVPPGTRVAHKTGWVGEVVYHDAAIVYPAHGAAYVLTVLTGGIKEDSVAHNLVADLSRMVYAASTSW